MSTDKNTVDLEKLSSSLKVIEGINNSINDLKLSNIVLDIDNNISKISFEHGNCFSGYKEILDSLIDSTNKLKSEVNELDKLLEKTISSFSDIENVNFRKEDLLTDVTKIPEVETETTEVQEKSSINTIPIGLGIGAAGIAGSVGMVAADSMGLIDDKKKDDIPEYNEQVAIVEKKEEPDEDEEFIAHEEKFDDVTPYHASRDKDVMDKFYDEEGDNK